MSRFTQRLSRIPTAHLIVFVAVTDVLLLVGVAPFEWYARTVALNGAAGTGTLIGMLLANLVFLAVLGAAMLASAALMARGANRAALVTLPVLRRRFSRGRSRRSGY